MSMTLIGAAIAVTGVLAAGMTIRHIRSSPFEVQNADGSVRRFGRRDDAERHAVMVAAATGREVDIMRGGERIMTARTVD